MAGLVIKKLKRSVKEKIKFLSIDPFSFLGIFYNALVESLTWLYCTARWRINEMARALHRGSSHASLRYPYSGSGPLYAPTIIKS
jgi:hypothetical protein